MSNKVAFKDTFMTNLQVFFLKDAPGSHYSGPRTEQINMYKKLLPFLMCVKTAADMNVNT